jgi:hypothetical protein
MFIGHFSQSKKFNSNPKQQKYHFKVALVKDFLKASTSQICSKIIKAFPKQRTGAQGLIKTLPPAF